MASIEDCNKLTEDELKCVLQIEAILVEEGIPFESYFELAEYAIVCKCDPLGAVKRFKHFKGLCDNTSMDSITFEDARDYVLKNSPDMLVSADCRVGNPDAYSVCAMVYKEFIPGPYAGEENSLMLLRFFILVMKYFNMDISRVRKGTVWVADAKGMGFKNFSLEMEKRFAGFYQDGYPCRMKGFVIVDAPIIIRAMMKIMSPFLKKKTTDRMKMYKSTDIPSTRGDLEFSPQGAFVTSDEIGSKMRGGSMPDQDIPEMFDVFRERRKQSEELVKLQVEKHVAEMQVQ